MLEGWKRWRISPNSVHRLLSWKSLVVLCVPPCCVGNRCTFFHLTLERYARPTHDRGRYCRQENISGLLLLAYLLLCVPGVLHTIRPLGCELSFFPRCQKGRTKRKTLLYPRKIICKISAEVDNSKQPFRQDGRPGHYARGHIPESGDGPFSRSHKPHPGPLYFFCGTSCVEPVDL